MAPRPQFVTLAHAGPPPRTLGEQGACRSDTGVDPDAWFPLPSDNDHTIALVLRVCQACPVRQACADYALPIVDLYGIWGGMSVQDRLRLRRGEDPTRLREIRRHHRITQTAVAAVAGVSTEMVSSWETGRYPPPADVVERYEQICAEAARRAAA